MVRVHVSVTFQKYVWCVTPNPPGTSLPEGESLCKTEKLF